MSTATAYTLTGPATVPFGQQSADFTLTLNGTWGGGIGGNQTLTINVLEYDQTNTMFYKPGDNFPPVGNEIQTAQYGTSFTWTPADTSLTRTFKIAFQTASEFPVLANTPYTNGVYHLATSNTGGLTNPNNGSGWSLAILCTPKPLELQRPGAYEVFQQSGGVADIKFAGWYTETGGVAPTAIEVSLDAGSTWQTLPVTCVQSHSGTAVSGTSDGVSTGTIVFDAGASATDGYYVGAVVELLLGTGSGQVGIVTGYVGATRTATVTSTASFSTAWDVAPDGSTLFIVRANPSAGQGNPFNINGTGLATLPNYPVNTGSVLHSVAAGTYTIQARWANDHSTTITIPGVTVGDVSSSPFASPAPPTTFSVPYSLPGGTTWNVGTLTTALTGTTTTGCTGAYLQLDAGASSTDNFYQWQTLSITSGTGNGNANVTIISYNGTTKVAALKANWSVSIGIPGAGSGYKIVDVTTGATVRTGTAQGGGNATIVLTGGNATNDYYKGAVVNTTGGTGSGQTAVILGGYLGPGYNGTTKVAPVSPPWKVVPDNTTTFSVQAIGDSNSLQYALHYAAAGDVIKLTAGASYVANMPGNGSVGSGATAGLGSGSNGSTSSVTVFRLEPKVGNTPIYVTTSDYASLPGQGTRVSPSTLSHMATIRAYTDSTFGSNPNGYGCLMTIGAASNYRFVGIDFLATDTCYQMNWLGLTAPHWDEDLNNQGITIFAATDVSQLPSHITFDRCVMRQVNASAQLQTHILMNGAYIACVDSYLSGAHSAQEANCIFVWNGPGPFKIVNNYLEACASQVIFGANDPIIPNLVPSDIEFVGNDCPKLLIHDPNSLTYDGNFWDCKNHFELKSGQRVLIAGNVFENAFGEFQGQRATSLTLTPRNSGGAAPFSIVADVCYKNNIVSGCGIAFHVTGNDPHSGWLYSGTKSTQRVQVTNNLFKNISDWFTFPGVPGLNNQSMWISGYSRDDGGCIDFNVSHNTLLYGPMVLDKSVAFNTSTGLVTCNAHGLFDGQKIQFRGTMPSVGSQGQIQANTTYFAHVIDSNTFYVYTAVDLYSSYYINDPNKPGSAPTFATGTKVIPGSTGSGCYLQQRFGYNALIFDGNTPPAAENFNLSDNVIEATYYAFAANNRTAGIDTLNSVTTNLVCQGNLLINCGNAGETLTAVGGATANTNINSSGSTDAISSVGFTNYSSGDYSLSGSSSYKNTASDGTNPGADFTALNAATANTISGNTVAGGSSIVSRRSAGGRAGSRALAS